MENIEYYNKDYETIIKNVIQTKFEEDLDESQIEFLTTRPLWTKNHTELQTHISNLIPLTHLVSTYPDPDNIHLRNNLDETKLRFINDSNDIILKEMITSGCHDNCQYLFDKKQVRELHIGYALSDDRLWRLHSWCVDFNDKIIETTQVRLAYLTMVIYINKTA
jgi:hypothetical protein